MSPQMTIARSTLEDVTVAPDSADAGTILSVLESCGVVRVPRWVGPKATARLRAEQDHLWRHEVQGIDMDHSEKAGRVIRLRRAALDPEVMPETCRLFEHPLMAEVSERYLKAPHILNREIFVSDHAWDETPILPLHYDQLQCLKFYVYLDDTAERDGAFAAVPGSHRFVRSLRQFHLSRGMPTRELPNKELPGELPEPVSITGDAGTLIVFDTDTCHMGGAVGQGRRRRVMRGHTRRLPMEVHGAKPITRQWWREHRLNPATAMRRGLDRLLGTRPPSLR